ARRSSKYCGLSWPIANPAWRDTHVFIVKPAVAPDDGTPDSAGEACAHSNDCGNTGSTQTRPARFCRVHLVTRTGDEGACSHEDFPWPPGIAKPGSAGLWTGRGGH